MKRAIMRPMESRADLCLQLACLTLLIAWIFQFLHPCWFVPIWGETSHDGCLPQAALSCRCFRGKKKKEQKKEQEWRFTSPGHHIEEIPLQYGLDLKFSFRASGSKPSLKICLDLVKLKKHFTRVLRVGHYVLRRLFLLRISHCFYLQLHHPGSCERTKSIYKPWHLSRTWSSLLFGATVPPVLSVLSAEKTGVKAKERQ